MAIHPDVLNEYMSRRGPCLFHVTRGDALPAIHTEGLRPGSEFGFSSKGGFFKTRTGHVYLGNLLSLPVVEVAGTRGYLAVDLTKLDPALVDPDEDQVQGSFDRRSHGWVAESPPMLPAGAKPEEVGHALAEWADAAEGFDASEVTAKSLESGRISYRGTIPPEAIKGITFLSEGPHLFYQGVQQTLNNPNLDHTPAPDLGFYKTEVARAIALARRLIACAADSVGESTATLLPDWPYSEHAVRTRDLLIGAVRERARAGEFPQAEILRGARRIANVVPTLQPKLGWAATRDACVNVAVAGLGVITCLRDHVSKEAATAAARVAMDAVAAVPDLH